MKLCIDRGIPFARVVAIVAATAMLALLSFSSAADARAALVQVEPPCATIGAATVNTPGLTQRECDILAIVYAQTGGATWQFPVGWSDIATGGETDPCNGWFGVGCGPDGIFRLDLSINGLSGSIPAEIGELTSLQYLNVAFNDLSGVIPTEIGQLTNLIELNLEFNDLAGPIPVEIGDLTNLQQVNLRRNSLQGSIPTEIGNLTNLQALQLAENNLSGSIPPAIGNLTNLLSLGLGSNALSGLVPSEIGALPDLFDLDLSGNNCLTASAATEAFITAIQAAPALNIGCDAVDDLVLGVGPNSVLIDVTENDGVPSTAVEQVTVVVPGSGTTAVEGNSVRYIPGSAANDSFDYEVCSGTFCDQATVSIELSPDEPPCTSIGIATVSTPVLTQRECDALAILYTQTGGDSWTGTNGWSTITAGGDTNPCNGWSGLSCTPTTMQLDLEARQLSGPLPAEIGNLTNLTELNLSTNLFLSGEIPVEIANLVNLTRLDLSFNSLSGPIPVEIAELASLTYLHLGFNSLSGAVPAELGNLTNLEDLRIPVNGLSGTIPPELGNLASLTYLSIHENSLSGTIPPELGNLTNLRHLELSSNGLSGSIPPELGNLHNLVHLLLSGNDLSGSLPAELGDLTELTSLSLSSNKLSGRIPAEITALTVLDELELYDNGCLTADAATAAFLAPIAGGDGLGVGCEAVDDVASVIAPDSVLIDVTSNDGLPLSAIDGLTATGATAGTLKIEGNSIRYTPDNGSAISDEFTYEACSGAFCFSATVTVAITPVGDAVDDDATVGAIGSVLIDVIMNDGLPVGSIDGLTVTDATTGTVNIEGTSIRYTPAGGSATSDTFTYEVCVGAFCDSATVNVTIIAPTCFGVPATVWGTTGDDVLAGTAGDDVIVGFDGDDMIVGGDGDDRICGHGGDDTISGDDGIDRLAAGSGNDTVNGGNSIDIIYGQDGNDTIYGNGGSDWIWAGDGIDTVFAGSGADRIFGDAGDDILNGQGGQDFMWGGDGNDTMRGSWQSDHMWGGPGNDRMEGARGKDIMYGEAGNDTMFGGTNTDYLDGGDGIDTADGQAGKDNPLNPGVSGCIAETTNSC